MRNSIEQRLWLASLAHAARLKRAAGDFFAFTNLLEGDGLEGWYGPSLPCHPPRLPHPPCPAARFRLVGRKAESEAARLGLKESNGSAGGLDRCCRCRCC